MLGFFKSGVNRASFLLIRSASLTYPIVSTYSIRSYSQGFNSHRVLVEWLKRDLKYVQPHNILRQSYAGFKLQISKLPNFSKFEHTICEELAALSDSDLSVDLTRQRLSKIYIDTFMSDETFQKKLSIFSGTSMLDALQIRAKSDNPLPTFDYICPLTLARNQQADVAARLAKAALDLSLEFQLGKLKTKMSSQHDEDCSAYRYVFGANITSAEFPNKFHLVENSQHAAVLYNGQLFKLQLFYDRKPVSADLLYMQIQTILKASWSKIHAPIGAMSAGKRQTCFNTRKILSTRSEENKKAFSLLDHARFVICLDTNNSSTVLSPSQMFLKNYQNRWYGMTQLVVGPMGESAFLGGYLKGVDGTTGIEVVDELVHRASQFSLSQEASSACLPEKINFDINNSDVAELDREAKALYHSVEAIFNIEIGAKFFKQLELSPQVAMNAILILAAYEISGKIPSASHAVNLRALHAPAVQTDWVHFSPNHIEHFYNTFQKRHLSDKEIFKLFQNLVEEHKLKVLTSKQGASPIFFMQKPAGKFYDILCEFFLSIGIDAPAFRNYLFRPYRNERSIDIMTSSLHIPNTLTLLGRPGSISEVLSMFGVHIHMDEYATRFIFIPNAAWVDKLPLILEKILAWMNRIKALKQGSAIIVRKPQVQDNIAAEILEVTSSAREADARRIGYPRGPHSFWSEARDKLGIRKDSLFDTYFNNAGDPSEEHTVKLKASKTECKLISVFANFYGLNSDDAFGYVTSGGAEGNFSALWWHRKDLESRAEKTPVVFISEHAHVAVFKSLDQLRLPYIKISASVEHGMNMVEFASKVQSYQDQPIIFFATVGTTTHGAIDDIPEAKRILNQCAKLPYAIHADAALLGAVLPITKPFGDVLLFNLIDTLVISGHKFFGTSEICGLVLATKALKSRIAMDRDINYMNLTGDITPFSSRSGRAVLEFYFNVHWLGLHTDEHERFTLLVKQSFEMVNYFRSKIIDIVGEANVICNPYQFNIVFPEPANKELVTKYGLMPVGKDQVSVCMLPGIDRQHLDEFFKEYSSPIVRSSTAQYSFRI